MKPVIKRTHLRHFSSGFTDYVVMQPPHVRRRTDAAFVTLVKGTVQDLKATVDITHRTYSISLSGSSVSPHGRQMQAGPVHSLRGARVSTRSKWWGCLLHYNDATQWTRQWHGSTLIRPISFFPQAVNCQTVHANPRGDVYFIEESQQAW